MRHHGAASPLIRNPSMQLFQWHKWTCFFLGNASCPSPWALWPCILPKIGAGDNFYALIGPPEATQPAAPLKAALLRRRRSRVPFLNSCRSHQARFLSTIGVGTGISSCTGMAFPNLGTARSNFLDSCASPTTTSPTNSVKRVLANFSTEICYPG